MMVMLGIYCIECEYVQVFYLVLQFEICYHERTAVNDHPGIGINDQAALIPAVKHIAFVKLHSSLFNALTAGLFCQPAAGCDNCRPYIVLATAGVIHWIIHLELHYLAHLTDPERVYSHASLLYLSARKAELSQAPTFCCAYRLVLSPRSS